MGHVIVSTGERARWRGGEGKGERGMGDDIPAYGSVFFFKSVFFVYANAPIICCPSFLGLYAAHEIFLMC
jgi:hypothetical protein